MTEGGLEITFSGWVGGLCAASKDDPFLDEFVEGVGDKHFLRGTLSMEWGTSESFLSVDNTLSSWSL